VFVTASRYEGWPIAVAEAMASGVPVVGFDIPGLRELVRPGTDGLLVAPGDVAALGRAVAALLSNRTLAAGLGASARERAMGWLTWQECGERFADTMEGVIRLERSGAGDASRSEAT
jgi:glycosyltransferase involved in cell wall biosynthesis